MSLNVTVSMYGPGTYIAYVCGGICEAQSCLHSRTLKPRSLLIPVIITCMYMKFCNVYLQTSILGLVYLNFLHVHVHTCTYRAETPRII